MSSILGGNTPAAPTPPTMPKLRAFGDGPATRQKIFDNVLSAASQVQPVENQRHTLSLQDVKYVGPETFSHEAYKRALLTGGTLSRKLQGRWVLADKATGQTLAEKRATIANVPWMTDHGTLVQRGNEYSFAHQMRLSPGAFARQKANGELETHVNILPGQGQSFRLQLHPETGIYKLHIGQAGMPLHPLLQAMGATKDQIREAWGDELQTVNQAKSDAQVIPKLYDRVVRNRVPDATPTMKAAAVAEAFQKMKLDPEITQRTLGHPHNNVTSDMLLAATKKLLAINRREAEPDDRDHMAYQHVMGPEDLIAERINKDHHTMRQMLWRASARQNLDHVQTGAFDKSLQAAIMSSGLSSPIEEINPAEILDQQSRITRMGEGGLPSLDAVPEDSRSVQPSHFGFVDFLRTPESGKVGVDMRLAAGARKGDDGKIYMPMRDVRTGQTVLKNPHDLADSTVAFPGELGTGSNDVRALVGGKLQYVKRNMVHYEPINMEDTFSPLANMIPLKSMVKGQRAVMASRMLTQALPLVDAEAPLVQSGMPGKPDRSFEEEYARHMGAVHAEKPGRVMAVTPGGISLTHSDGTKSEIQLHQNTPFNRKTSWTQTPVVQPGDAVQPGQLLAHSNFTNKQGVTALGKNMRVAYIPFRGLNFEDAVVLSESAARRMTSEHTYQHTAEWQPTHRRGRNSFISIFPAKYDKKVLANFDEDGIIKKGTQVDYDHPLVLQAREKERTYGQVHRGRSPSFVDESLTWHHHSPGIVTDVERTDKGVNVVVKSHHPLVQGDKVSGRYGDKGIVSDVIPDDQMPSDRDGKPFELLTNPLGVISRSNPAQVAEAALGKIAAVTGKPYKVEDWTGKDMREFAEAELRKHNMSDKEDVHDPETGRKIPGILTGNRFFMKLHHTAESKGQGRSIGGYTAEGAPAKGGESGSKRMGTLELGALLSHGAIPVIRDAKLVRGQANPQYWQQYMAGYTPPPPSIPHVHEKFINLLRASGINPVREGTKTHIMALTDRDVDKLAGDRELQNADTVDWKSALKPKPGGLFDETMTGGHGGERWSKITLHEAMPSPVMEEPIRRVLGLTEKRMRDIIGGKEQLNGLTGPEAISKRLKSLNIDRELEQARADIASNRKTKKDAAVRKLGYLKDAKRLGIHPGDWVLNKVPVLPPSFRPVTTMGPKKLPLVADPNYLYKELFEANKNLRELSGQVDDTGEERLALYDSLKAVTGLGDPIQPKNVERNVQGALRQIFKSSPKMGIVQRRLLSTTTDLVGRAVISPNPSLDMDHVGMPENKAWEVYAPMLVRNLTRKGLPGHRAMELVTNREPVARQALLEEMGKRPVIITRAPVLHRYGVMASYPKLVKGHTLQLSPLVVGGFGADFDGDAMNYYVPSTDEAARDAEQKMLPSKNLISAANFGPRYGPSQEYTGGLHAASSYVDTGRPVRTFATQEAAIRAYRRGDINVGSRIEILNQ